MASVGTLRPIGLRRRLPWALGHHLTRTLQIVENMGALLAIMVFVYPLAFPLLTIGLLFYAGSTMNMGLRAALLRIAAILAFLMLALSPSIESNGAGSFLLPWWLQVLVGSTDAKYYPGIYLLACLSLLAVFILGIGAYRHLAQHSVKPPKR